MSRAVMLTVWAAAAALLVVVAIAPRIGRHRVASFGRVVSTATSRLAGLIVILLFWAWAGWHFFAR